MTDADGPAILDLRGVRRALSAARGRQKLDLIIDAPDPGQLVRSLPAEELYFALLDIGPEDAPEIVAMATPEQFRHFLDMAAWRSSDEGPQPRELLRWLRLARDPDEAEGFRGKLAALDAELLSLLLHRELRVYDLTQEEPPQPENPGMAFYSPDGRFLLEFVGSGEFAAMRHVVEDLYAQNPFLAGRLIESVRWEMPTELEELARRCRSRKRWRHRGGRCSMRRWSSSRARSWSGPRKPPSTRPTPRWWRTALDSTIPTRCARSWRT